MARRSRRRAKESGSEAPRGPTPGFVELVAPRAGRELVVVLEDAQGTRVRIELRDGGAFDLVSLARALGGRET